MSLHLSIVTPDKVVLKEDVSHVYLPGAEGEIGILEAHTPMISVINPGMLRYSTLEGEIKQVAVGPGFVQVEEDHLDVIVSLALDDATTADQTYEEAISQAKKALEHVHQMSEQDSARLEANIGKTINLLELRRKNHRG